LSYVSTVKAWLTGSNSVGDFSQLRFLHEDLFLHWVEIALVAERPQEYTAEKGNMNLVLH
jgi:hypothetical protein